MLFNSGSFLAFFFLVYSAYLLLIHRHRAQNLLLLTASYFFYGCWDWRFLSLVCASTLMDFFFGRAIHASTDPHRRKLLVTLSVALNLTILGFFKYFNFFIGNAAHLLSLLGLNPGISALNLILPVGISFYTFESLSYTIDIYRREIDPATNLIDFALFIAYFPHLVAGPIVRASSLLPQISRPRTLRIDQIHAGVFLILWGYFKKMAIADNMGIIADKIFNHYSSYHGLDLTIGVLAFAVQIYGDFSGYTDIARGISKLMGFEINLNFKLPYFAESPSDFWQRWHISLSSWLRDYLYIPLGGNRDGSWKTSRNLGLTMLLGGLWHGAAWNFVLWGAFHGLILMIYRIRLGLATIFPRPVRILAMFTLTMIGWVLFRSRSLGQIHYILSHLGLAVSPTSRNLLCDLVFFTLPLAAVEFWQHRSGDLLIAAKLSLKHKIPFYAFIITWMIVFRPGSSMEFIYFQF